MFEPRRGSVDCEIKEGEGGGGTKRRNKTILVIESDRYRKQLTFDQNPSWMAGNFAAGNLSRSRLFAFSSHDFKSPPHPDVTRSNGETQGKGRCEYIFNYTGRIGTKKKFLHHHLLTPSFALLSLIPRASKPKPPTSASPRLRISSFVSLVPIQPETESPVPGYF